MECSTGSPNVGRPRSFDADRALDAAMRVFWQHGYEGASLSALTAAMGINRPSLYAAFGNKEALFRRAVERYVEGTAGLWKPAMAAPTARETVETLVLGMVPRLTCPEATGCLSVHGALACGEDGAAVSVALSEIRAAGEATLRARLERAQVEGDLSADADPASLAKYVVTVLHGLAVQARSGTGEEELLRVARIALRAWPV